MNDSIDIKTHDPEKLRAIARAMGVKVRANDSIEVIQSRLAEKVGDLGFSNLGDSADAAKERAAQGAAELMLDPGSEIAGLAAYPTDIKVGTLPNLLPGQNPWGGRRRRIRRIRNDKEQQVLFLIWNGYPFIIPPKATYADLPYPHFLTLLNATTDKMTQRKQLDNEGRADWVDEFHEVINFPIQDMGLTPGTEHLPRSMKEYLYSSYIEGFPGFTPNMWKVIAASYSYNNKLLGIVPGMAATTQAKTRRMAVLDRLNIMDLGDAKAKHDNRVEIIAEILAESPIAEAA